MNQQIVQAYIQAYKDQFDQINQQELYKWRAVKQFQDHWDIEAEDFAAMIQEALSQTFNLLDSGLYYPKGMLLECAQVEPEEVRALFKDLYNEEIHLFDRIEDFRLGIIQIVNANFEVNNHYQDHRAVMVYLVLKYPERFFLYKFGMFKKFAMQVDYPYIPVKGRIENISHFENLCEQINHIVSSDQELLRLHHGRLTEDCYIDEGYHILTQDIIYASVRHIQIMDDNENEQQNNNEVTVEILGTNQVAVENTIVNFTGSITNHIQNNKENKRIGDLGELFVIQLEKQKLLNANMENLAKRVAHHSKEQGDGLGYDILSFDMDGNEMYIEVKATKSNKNTPFYITRNELERSIQEKNNYYIYRVYNFNDETLRGDVLILQGDASNLCVEAVNYKVKMM